MRRSNIAIRSKTFCFFMYEIPTVTPDPTFFIFYSWSLANKK